MERRLGRPDRVRAAESGERCRGRRGRKRLAWRRRGGARRRFVHQSSHDWRRILSYRDTFPACDNFKIAKNVRENDFPSFQGINRRRDGSASQHGVPFGKTAAADAAGHSFVVNCQESGKRLSLVRVAGDRSRDQDRGIEHRLAQSGSVFDLLVSDGIHDRVPIETAGRLALVNRRCRVLGPWMICVRPDEAPGHLDALRGQARSLREVVGDLELVRGG